jgi:hypothetical protein
MHTHAHVNTHTCLKSTIIMPIIILVASPPASLTSLALAWLVGWRYMLTWPMYNQEGSMNWNAPPPRVACPANACPLLWCPNSPTCPEAVGWWVLLLCADKPDQPLVELEFDANDKSEGNLLELSILICSWSLRTHTEMISSLLSSCNTRKECCYGNTTMTTNNNNVQWLLTKSPSMPGLALGSFCILESRIGCIHNTYYTSQSGIWWDISRQYFHSPVARENIAHKWNVSPFHND